MIDALTVGFYGVMGGLGVALVALLLALVLGLLEE